METIKQLEVLAYILDAFNRSERVDAIIIIEEKIIELVKKL